MKTYYIYHILGIKIGCTSDLNRRMKQQGFTEWEILETHTNAQYAGDREKELQLEYGYPIDDNHYVTAVNNRRKFNKDDMAKGGRNSITQLKSKITTETCAKGGRAGKGIPKPKTKCPHCNRMIANNVLNRFHNNNCKLRTI
tara:strand:+ start:85 stop:510 length:426 start_codon:yes stop_codon:yes gene_type:complete